ncbi:MAG: gamma-glutamyl-gamma-aminobutyrate hydrolase family protein [Candidatus Aenigmarchaeota archaeon]|nr:gamma-glutamyl-gamma-aminobutyrate hydrolase family protein [Candidatus Aenigmarchaeota archaeon]
MKILLVNNITKHLEELREILKPHEITTVNFQELPKNYSDFDCIILSGGSKYKVKNNEEIYKQEIELIKNSEIPVFGICLGFELICHFYGEKIEMLKEKKRGLRNLEIIEKDSLLKGIEKLSVFEAHRFYVKKVKNLILLAKSEIGAEIIKHREKPVYGVQFHPEIRLEKNQGTKILTNFLKLCKTK